jgi:hypothetical protein
MVCMSVGVQTVDFMLDTGTEHSVVTRRVTPISKRHQTIVGLQRLRPAAIFSSPENVLWEGIL